MAAKSANASGAHAPGAGGTRRLVIVESPAKARTIAGYLGRGYVVESSVGHIRDLPAKKTDVPAAKRDRFGAPVGVDVDGGFDTLYLVPADKKPQVKKLKDLLKDADELFLATDEDREGEAIAWHLREELKPTVPVRRMVFHEITPDAIARAVESPREIDERLVDAQEARRIVDRLYGYEVSPVLWRKVTQGLSAGRVQSVATRLVVDRERERMAFRAAEYWDLEAVLGAAGSGPGQGRSPDDPATFAARLVGVDGRRVATGRDFGSDGQLKARSADTVRLDEAGAAALAGALADAPFAVTGVESKPYRRSPYAPFRTTTLQQEASRKLGFGAKRTMQVAQRLYENGHITYMRTDSTTLSQAALDAARAQVRELYGAEYLPDAPRTYASKVKNAQEAHEAIRPAGDAFRTPGQTGLTGDEYRLYELIWMRTVASQMRDAVGESVTVRVEGRATDGRVAEFSASGKVITFHGFLKAYVEGADDPEAELDSAERRLPQVAQGDALAAVALRPEGHSTKPPARYTEATLVKELEDREIGRPSTYASIIGTILDRGYVFKKGTALVPSWLAFAVVRLLEEHFSQLVDYDFTARMEDVLDEVAGGAADRRQMLGRFWHGDGDVVGLKQLVDSLGDIDARGISSFPVGDGVTARVGRYGPYVEDVQGRRANIPEDLPPEELTLDRALELLAQPSGDRELGTDPQTGRTVVAKSGRYGPYVTEIVEDEAANGAADADAVAVPAGGVPDGAGPDGAGPDGAEPDGAGPREGGTGDGASAAAKPKSTRSGGARAAGKARAVKPRTASLLSSMTLDSVTLEDALRLLSLPRVIGAAPDGEEVLAAKGRYGPYVKKGSEFRSLENDDLIFAVTLDEALALLAQPKGRRAAAAAALRELGPDPVSGKVIQVKDGRFGPYVTDGEVNATLRKGDDPESITPERAAELLAEKRARGPAPKRRRSRS